MENALDAARRMPGLFHPPVLVIPDIFEPDLRRALIDGYKKHGGEPSGFMRDVEGRTTYVEDPRHKIRRDWLIEDMGLLAAIQQRINRRVEPEIYKAFQFRMTRTERFIVACYTAADGGHFRAHRDNTTIGTAHRRFAMSVNLNAEDYEGGDLRFPEFGPATYRAPSGGGIVFSCSLLHEATRVTGGERYAFLPFFYDEEGERIRQENLPYTDNPA
jgi:predicted 2-oxoglutarate/Fe(II)-dependent dioxygenase YbiX